MVVTSVTVGTLSQQKLEDLVVPQNILMLPVEELTDFDLISENSLENQWLFCLRPGAEFQSSKVRSFLKKLQDQTYQSYAALFNLHTRYLLVSLRG
ncbi:MAG: hypothetical protein ACFFBD_27850 [Candidatus Hodarchaeota archaeon]